MSSIIPLVFTNASLDVIENIAIDVCVLIKPSHCASKQNCTDVCTGAIHEFAYEVLEIAFTTVLTPSEICFILSQCPKPTPPPPFIPTLRIASNLSDDTGAKLFPSYFNTTGTGTFIHVSDIHLDLLYTSGSNTKCGEPLCCRADDGPGTSANNTAGVFGDYACDTSMNTFESFLQQLQLLDPQPDFIIFTGDSPPHDIWKQSREGNLASLTTQSQLFASFLPSIPVYSVLGNHASFPVNQYRGPDFDSWLYEPVAQLWSPYLSDDAVKTASFGGFYSLRIRQGLVLLAMHTTMMVSDNFWLFGNASDVGGQLVWAEDVLKQVAATEGDRVIITGHHSLTEWMPTFQTTFFNLLQKYQSVILNLFFGHTHDMAVWVYHDQQNEAHPPLHVAYSAGSLTTYTNLNPAFRVYNYPRINYDAAPFLVTDYHQHWMELADSNLKKVAQWGERYTALNEYELSDLSPQSWQSFGESFVKGTAPSNVVNSFLKDIFNGAPNGLPDRASTGCDILCTTKAEYANCTKGWAYMPKSNHKKC